MCLQKSKPDSLAKVARMLGAGSVALPVSYAVLQTEACGCHLAKTLRAGLVTAPRRVSSLHIIDTPLLTKKSAYTFASTRPPLPRSQTVALLTFPLANPTSPAAPNRRDLTVYSGRKLTGYHAL
ncbi:hypothetical protein AMC87_PD00901 (plasmid) [Rhizobium phaseoli]|nr:hypothetical protein AMC87_PD00901 [Rhizobium phaseoli]